MKRLIAITTFAAALLLGGTAHAAGWYLLAPYYYAGQFRTDVPFKYWQQIGAFDSAYQCQNTLAWFRSPDGWNPDGNNQFTAEQYHERIKSSVCVDDARIQ